MLTAQAEIFEKDVIVIHRGRYNNNKCVSSFVSREISVGFCSGKISAQSHTLIMHADV